MAETLTISSAPDLEIGLNYDRLRTEGIKHIAALAGDIWSDHNAHDPGITTLEILCYALTDLSYRLSFDIQDLLAYPADAPLETRQQFFTAREILTVNPVTINDYRKLLIDIEGVKNAWLEPIENPHPALYSDSLGSMLSFATPELTQPVPLKGLYRVLLDRELGYTETQLVEAAKARLFPCRNLCEDFAEIKVLGVEEITVRTELEIEEGVNPNQLMAQIYAAIDSFISPSIRIWSLSELLEKGRSPETIFDGPALEHGFIDDEQLQQFERKTALHTSDLIHIILNMAGVKSVKSIAIASSQSPTEFENWSLSLDANLTPRLKSLKANLSNFTFYRGQIPYTLNLDQVEQSLETLTAIQTADTLNYQSLDLPIPKGDYRELSDYETIQNEFPLTYGIGDIGLPPSATTQRQAQAKQFQAYLTVFDQLLANACAQLDGFKDLFSFRNPTVKSYFAQSIAHHPSATELLATDYSQTLTALPEDTTTALDRKNRLLNHLLAHFSERFTDDVLLSADGSAPGNIIQQKVNFLSDYLRLSAGRGKAYNTATDPNSADSSENISGLKRRVSRLLGIPAQQQFLASSDQPGFHIVEHILMRPHEAKAPEEEPGYLGFSKPINAFSPSDVLGQVTCQSPSHQLKENETITIFYSSNYSGTYTIIPRLTESGPDPDSFDILADYIPTTEGAVPNTGQWISNCQTVDPFSFQISIVLPAWPERFQSRNVKRLLYDTLIAETPAHITLYLHWLERDVMREFETTYALWRQHLSGTSAAGLDAQQITYRLLNMLQLGSSTIPGLPAILGYMGVGENFEVY
ncbi:MAG: hypothetical protein AAFQ63_13880 [Cyanobacteria bacterium J06621_11]